MRRRLALLSLLALVAPATGCAPFNCVVYDCWPGGDLPDGSYVCVDSWQCTNAVGVRDVYQVRCTSTAGGDRDCRCFMNGIEGRQVQAQPWCGYPESEDPPWRISERIVDADDQCGWSMTTCHI